MPYRTNDRRRQDELRLEQQSLARGDALEYGAIAACRDRNKAAIAAAKAELEQASEALRTEPSESNTARYMRAVRRMQELREERRKLWGVL
jgi:isoaspartyl peptidase/L-asparaginase-like protein (Ntn-hydrolase superfamily)